MPRLPDIDQLGPRPIPSGRGAAVSLDLQTPRPSQEYQALAELGQSLSGLGNSVHQLIQREKLKNDEAQVEEAFSQYVQWQDESEHDPETGYRNILGGEAINRETPLAEEMRKKRQEAEERIAQTLKNPEQLQAFKLRVQPANRLYDTRVYKHTAEQSRVYRSQAYEGGLASERQHAALNYQEPGAVELSLLRVQQLVMKQAREAGLNPEIPEDAAIINDIHRTEESKLHAEVISMMMVRGEDIAARVYYNEMLKADRLDTETAVALATSLESVSNANEVQRGADVVWDTTGPKGLNDPVRMDVMSQRVRDIYKDRPDLAADIIDELSARTKMHNDSQKEVVDKNRSEVLKAGREGVGLPGIQRMPQFIALDGDDQREVLEYVRDYQAGIKTRDGAVTYHKLKSNPEQLRNMSFDAIESMRPVMGDKYTDELLADRAAFDQNPVQYTEAVLDEDMFKAVAAEAFPDYDVYSDKLNSEVEEMLGRLRSKVKDVIQVEEARAQKRSGVGLSRTEKQDIMRKIVDEKLIETLRLNTEIPSVSATAKARREEAIKVPIDVIERRDPMWLSMAINYMRSEGVIPIEWSDRQVVNEFRDRFEYLYAYSLTGGDPEEGIRMLIGRPERKESVRDMGVLQGGGR